MTARKDKEQEGRGHIRPTNFNGQQRRIENTSKKKNSLKTKHMHE